MDVGKMILQYMGGTVAASSSGLVPAAVKLVKDHLMGDMLEQVNGDPDAYRLLSRLAQRWGLPVFSVQVVYEDERGIHIMYPEPHISEAEAEETFHFHETEFSRRTTPRAEKARGWRLTLTRPGGQGKQIDSLSQEAKDVDVDKEVERGI